VLNGCGNNPEVMVGKAQTTNIHTTALGFFFGGKVLKDVGFETTINVGGCFIN